MLNCREKGHFKKECTTPPQRGNHNPFNINRNQNTNPVKNTKREMLPIRNTNQVGPSNTNSNKALIVQSGESCDCSIKLGYGGLKFGRRWI
ncbi:putative transcription factor interactor and regulator CCHC(Zn) family [Helianthus anomalus]